MPSKGTNREKYQYTRNVITAVIHKVRIAAFFYSTTFDNLRRTRPQLNKPVIIKYSFWEMTAANPKAIYACINYGEAFCPQDIEKQAICLDADIGKVIKEIM